MHRSKFIVERNAGPSAKLDVEGHRHVMVLGQIGPRCCDIGRDIRRDSQFIDHMRDYRRDIGVIFADEDALFPGCLAQCLADIHSNVFRTASLGQIHMEDCADTNLAVE